jgi:hypothetical protein
MGTVNNGSATAQEEWLGAGLDGRAGFREFCSRLGEGGGFAGLEFALATAAGLIGPAVG